MTIPDREADFWDKVVERSAADDQALRILANDLCDPAVPWFKHLDLDRFVAAVFAHIDPKPGMRILDLGCGKGFLSVALAHRGAVVEGVDISPRSIGYSIRRAETSGVSDRTTFTVMDCKNLTFEDESFDAVCGGFVLHHLDLENAAQAVGRVLKPGGKAAFIETMGLNPLLMLARATLPGRLSIQKESSDDEYPLDRPRLAKLQANFPGRVRTSFPQIVFLRMGGYLPFLDNRWGIGLMTGLDHLIARAPALGPLSYYGLVTMDRGSVPEC